MAIIPSFKFNAAQPGSYEEMQRRRALAAALAKGVYQNQPRNTVEGVGAVAEALASRWNQKRATDMEQQGRKQASEQFNAMIAGGNPDLPTLAQAAGNPFLTDGQNAVVEAMIGKQFETPKAPDLETLFDEQTGREYKGRWNPQTGQFDRVGGMKAPSKGMTVYDRDGNPIMTTGDAKPFTEYQGKDIFWAKRLRGSAPLVDQYEKGLTDFMSANGGKMPIVGNYLKSQEYRLGEQAAKEWVAPILRKETGAAVTPGEFEFYGDIFIPKPGDDDATIAAKRAARQRAMEALEAGMSPAQIAAAGIEVLQQHGAGTGAPAPAPGDEEVIDLGTF